MKTILNTSDKETILSRIIQVQHDSERQWGKMTVNQMICHCTDQIRSAIGEIETKDRTTFSYRTFIKFLALYVIKIPKGKVKTVSEFDQDKKGTRPTEFKKDHQELINSLERFENASQYYPHPTFGKLSKKEWSRLIYVHLDHHLTQFGV